MVFTQMCDMAASFRSPLRGCAGTALEEDLTSADVGQTISAVLHALNAGTGERDSQRWRYSKGRYRGYANE